MAVSIPRGMRASLTALAGSSSLKPGGLYYVTDESRVVLGVSTTASVDVALKSEIPATGTSGHTIPFLDGANVFSGNNTFTGADLTQTSAVAPTRLGSLANSALAGSIGMAVVDRVAYVANSNNSSLTSVDVSDPANPLLLSTVQDFTLLSGAFGVVVSGRYAFVTVSGNTRVTVVDISNPYAMTLVHSYQDTTNISGPRGLAVAGKYLYVGSTSNNRLTVLDISNPLALSTVGSLQDATHLFGIDGVTVSGKYAYVAAKDANYISIVDISDPAAPVYVGNTPVGSYTSNVHEVQVIGRYLYSASQNSHSIAIHDVSNPASPTFVGGLVDSVNLASPKHIYVANGYAYVTDNGNSRLTIVNVSNPASPTLVSTVLSTTYVKFARAVVVQGKAIYVAAEGIFSVYSAPGLSTPTANVGSLSTHTIENTGSVNIGQELGVLGGAYVSGGIRTDTGISVMARSSSSTASAADFRSSTGASLFYVRNDGRVGIGQSSPAYTLDVNGSLGATSATVSGAVAVGSLSMGTGLTANPALGIGTIGTVWTNSGTSALIELVESLTAVTSATRVGLQVNLDTTGTATGVSVFGTNSTVKYSGSGTISSLIATNAASTLSAAVTAASVQVFRTRLGVSVTGGTITAGYNYQTRSPAISAGGAITTAYGFYSSAQKVTGVTTGYGFYQQGASDLNVFEGSLSALSLAGTLLSLTPRTAPSSPADGDVWVTATAVQARVGGATKTLATTDQLGGGGGGGSSGVYVQPDAPTGTSGAYLWVQTNYGTPGDFTVWFDDGLG